MGDEKEKDLLPLRRFKGKVRFQTFLAVTIVIVVITMYTIKTNPQQLLFDNSKEVFEDDIIGQEGTVTTVSKSALEKVLSISELSTVSYSYNAVAQKKEENLERPAYYVAYEGAVTAGIDFKKIGISVNEEAKTILLTIPECEIQNTTVDFGSMNFIFSIADYENETISQEAYELCRQDLEIRADKDVMLLDMAKENVIAAVEALVRPWVNQVDQEYKITIQ